MLGCFDNGVIPPEVAEAHCYNQGVAPCSCGESCTLKRGVLFRTRMDGGWKTVAVVAGCCLACFCTFMQEKKKNFVVKLFTHSARVLWLT